VLAADSTCIGPVDAKQDSRLLPFSTKFQCVVGRKGIQNASEIAKTRMIEGVMQLPSRVAARDDGCELSEVGGCAATSARARDHNIILKTFGRR
jgi:hypothetical protein